VPGEDLLGRGVLLERERQPARVLRSRFERQAQAHQVCRRGGAWPARAFPTRRAPWRRRGWESPRRNRRQSSSRLARSRGWPSCRPRARCSCGTAGKKRRRPLRARTSAAGSFDGAQDGAGRADRRAHGRRRCRSRSRRREPDRRRCRQRASRPATFARQSRNTRRALA